MKSITDHIPKKVLSWLVWGIAVLYYLYEYIHRIAPSVMIQPIMYSFRIDTAEMGALASTYFWIYGMMQIPVGIVVDNYGPKRPLLVACILITIGSFGFGFSHELVFAYVCRGLIGLGSAFGYLCCLKICVNWFSSRRFALMCGLVNMIGMLGAFAGEIVLSKLLDDYTWRQVVYSLSYVGILIIVLLWIFVRDFPHESPQAQFFKKSHHIGENLKRIITSKHLWLCAVYVGCIYCTFDTIAALWGVSFIQKSYGISRDHAAEISSLIFLGAMAGYPVFGFVTSYFNNAHKRIMIISSLCILALGIGIWSGPKDISVLVVLFALLGFFAGVTATATTLAKEYMPLSISGLTMSVINTVLVFAGAASEPLFGYLLQVNQTVKSTSLAAVSVSDFQRAFLIMPGFYFISLVCAVCIKQSRGQVS